jgi:hypothetical protein
MVKDTLEQADTIMGKISNLKFSSTTFQVDMQIILAIANKAWIMQQKVNGYWSSLPKDLRFSDNAFVFRKINYLAPSVFQEIDYWTTHLFYPELEFE